MILEAKPLRTILSTLCLLLLLTLATSRVAQANDTPIESLPEQSTEVQLINTPTLSETSETEGEDDSQDSALWEAILQPIDNTTTVNVTVPHLDEILENGEADTLVVKATMSYAGAITRDVETEIPLDSLTAEGVLIDFQNFGKFTAELTFQLDGQPVWKAETKAVGVTADEYNIAPVSATLPTTFFSLNLWGDESIRIAGPTIIMMERPNAYSWDNLPQAEGGLYGVYALPYLTRDEATYQPGDANAASDLFRKHADAVADYVADLYSLNPSSRFNLYCVDFYAGLIQRVIYANQIPEGQYSITLMSDGSWSYNAFSANYNSNDAVAQEARYVEEWNTAKALAYENGTVDSAFLDWGKANQYLWALIDAEEDAQWWVARKDLLISPNDGNAFGTSVQTNPKVIQINIADLLAQNIQPSEQNTKEFKALYNFNDSYFKAAEENDKEVMLFLGTRVGNEVGFSDYARFAMTYYGDGYQYYYKGHPGTPTELYPNKQEQLASLGITDVDSSVAAELILFFNPQIFLSGYNSSTYASVPKGMAKGMFEMTKATGLANPEYADMDYWSSRVTDTTPAAIRNLCPSGHSCYLVEFSDAISAEKGYDIAIWDATDSVATYYRGDAQSGFTKVGSDEGVTGDSAVESGEYVIKSSLSDDKVLDLASGSSADGANVQLWTYNASAAQRWQITVDEQGYATIVSAASGKPLDVQNGQATSGTNVQQYAANGSLAQKWRLIRNDDGSVRIVSALSNDLVLDVNAGSSDNGANVQIWSSNGSVAQSFTFLPTKPDVTPEGQADLKDGYYTLICAANTSKSLDIRDWSRDNGAKLQIWESTGWENQTFRISRQPSGFYRIESAWSDRSLDMTDGSILPGTAVQQYGSTVGNKNQEWAIFEQTGGSYTIQNVATGLLLDVFTGQATDGQSVVGYTANGTQAQRWLISEALDPRKTLDEWARENASVLPNGTYVIANASSGTVLDVSAGSHDSGANVQVYTANFTDAQKWAVSHDENGYVTFTNLGSGKVLDVSAGLKTLGTNVQQYDGNGSAAQKWIVMRQEDGSMAVVSALSSTICLDIQDEPAASGSNVRVYARDGSPSQRFSFYELVK